MKILFLLAMSLSCATAGEKNATATWITDGTIDPQTKVMRTLVKMTMNESWHTYWLNPGDSGLAPSIKLELPEGWKAGELQFPVPKRFKTGELAGFGYEGEAYFPLDIIAPQDFTGSPPPIKSTFSWLICNDDTCVPGKMEITLETGSHTDLISQQYNSLPKSFPEAILNISKTGASIQLTLTLPESSDFDPSKFEILPATPDIIDPAATPVFSKSSPNQNVWTASAPINEYLSEEPTKISILLKNQNSPSYLISTP